MRSPDFRSKHAEARPSCACRPAAARVRFVISIRGTAPGGKGGGKRREQSNPGRDGIRDRIPIAILLETDRPRGDESDELFYVRGFEETETEELGRFPYGHVLFDDFPEARKRVNEP